MRFDDVYTKWNAKKLTAEQAAEILGVHKRTFRRQCRLFEEEGTNGLYDTRLNKVAHNAASVDEVIELLNTYETHYKNFTVAHFYDKWQLHHKGTRSYSWVKKILQESGLIKK